MDNDILEGVRVGKDEVMVSQLQYANDTIIFGEWSKENACSLMNVLSVLKRLPIGVNMRRVSAWNDVIDRFKSRLFEWKAKAMSFGSRLTLVKSAIGALEKVRKNFFWGGLGEGENFMG
ncbi:hypothetical protein Tco_0770786 [Tanacetum coccineum]|uniref:Reverse transcriptase n=1 Tax=Tanacetum coccineum TaxID=301880 RepID=A0ABQ4ZGJ0_9ASTR